MILRKWVTVTITFSEAERKQAERYMKNLESHGYDPSDWLPANKFSKIKGRQAFDAQTQLVYPERAIGQGKQALKLAEAR